MNNVVIAEACTVALCVALTPDYKFTKCGSAMKISAPDAITINQQSRGCSLATGNAVVGEEDGLTGAYLL